MYKTTLTRGVTIEDFTHLSMLPSLGKVFDHLGDVLTIGDAPLRTRPQERTDGQRTPALWGPLGPGCQPATIVKITDPMAPGLIGGRGKAEKKVSTWCDLKRARELGGELGHKHRHPVALAKSLGITVHRASPAWFSRMELSPLPPGCETVGFAFTTDKEIYFSSTQTHNRQLAIIAHECAHFLEPLGDEQWCDEFSKAFISACAAHCPRGHLENLLLVERAA